MLLSSIANLVSKIFPPLDIVVVPENIHTPPMEGFQVWNPHPHPYGNSILVSYFPSKKLGIWTPPPPPPRNFFNLPSLGWAWTFSGTTHSVLWYHAHNLVIFSKYVTTVTVISSFTFSGNGKMPKCYTYFSRCIQT